MTSHTILKLSRQGGSPASASLSAVLLSVMSQSRVKADCWLGMLLCSYFWTGQWAYVLMPSLAVSLRCYRRRFIRNVGVYTVSPHFSLCLVLSLYHCDNYIIPIGISVHDAPRTERNRMHIQLLTSVKTSLISEGDMHGCLSDNARKAHCPELYSLRPPESHSLGSLPEKPCNTVSIAGTGIDIAVSCRDTHLALHDYAYTKGSSMHATAGCVR
ncbi:hypothetical protein B0H21DRAFT_714895 [Amylocystis lapponica]|nr:hypothetical protein B0H21DRAFT_714895 [Amylocystis lapponica]